MTERLLQYIWQFQYFNKKDLETTSGERLLIIHQGSYNRNQGPDFLEARIRIANNTWAGNVELHINASGWYSHSHSSDPNYRNVILHVVWKDDNENPRHEIPTLILADRVSKLLLQQYEQWMDSSSFIPCGRYLYCAEEITWIKWKERLLIERLERRYLQVKLLLEQNTYHWEEVFWWMLARNFGLYVNAEAFEELARSVPYNILLKHRNNLRQIEAILLGQAGLIEKENTGLQKEYKFYAKKYGLKKIMVPFHLLRMRPSAFPVPRVKQLAAFVNRSESLFSFILHTENLKQLKSVFPLNAIINAVVPVLFTYGKCRQEDIFMERAVDIINYIPPEKNSIILQFKKLGIENSSAAHSQALIELKTQYCDKRRCLDCSIGNAILKRKI
jgi:hypothetical protein